MLSILTSLYVIFSGVNLSIHVMDLYEAIKIVSMRKLVNKSDEKRYFFCQFHVRIISKN